MKVVSYKSNYFDRTLIEKAEVSVAPKRMHFDGFIERLKGIKKIRV